MPNPILTSKERMISAISLEEPDMVPIAPYTYYFTATSMLGLKASDYILGSNKTRAKILMDLQKRYRYDWIPCYYGHPRGWRKDVKIRDLGDRFEVFNKVTGSTEIVPKYDAQYVPFRDMKLEDIKDMEIPDHMDIIRSGEMEQVQIISNKIGDKVLVNGTISAPFFRAIMWVGLKRWIVSLYREPNLANKVMDKALEYNVERAKAYVEAGAESINIEACFTGADTISPAFYEKFGFPFEHKLIMEVKRLGVPVILYFCGDAMPYLNKILETEADAYLFEESIKGFVIDIFKIREALRNRACFFIPVDVVNLLPRGDFYEIRKKITDIISKTADGGGVVLSTGTAPLQDTSPESFKVMVDTARRVGKYPVRLRTCNTI